MSMSNSDSGTDSLPPSAKYVHHVLEEADRPLTKRELAQETNLPLSTVTYALGRLDERDLVVSRRKYRDLRVKEWSPSGD